MLSSDPKSDSLAGRRVAVTGASGFLGSLLVRSLLKCQAQVLGIDLNVAQTFANEESSPLEIQQVDLSCLGSLEECLRNFQPDTLYHLASSPDKQESYGQVQASIHNNLQLTVNVLEAHQRAGGQLFVYGDSSKSYGDAHQGAFHSHLHDQPLSSYAIAKSAGWHFCRYYDRLHGMQVVSVRPTLIYGPSQRHNLITYVIESVIAGKSVIRLDGGEQTRDPLYCDDAIEAFLSIAKHGSQLSGKVINLGGGREISVMQIVELILQIMDCPNTKIGTDSRRMRPTESSRNFCDNQEARELLDWQPQTSLEAGLQKTIAHLVTVTK